MCLKRLLKKMRIEDIDDFTKYMIMLIRLLKKMRIETISLHNYVGIG